MPQIEYVPRRFSEASEHVILQARQICADYAAQGFDLTLRQLFYQFVSRDLLANSQRSYNRLGAIINDARLAGQLDWNYIVDRTRNVRSGSHWTSPAQIIRAVSEQYAIEKWKDQPIYVEVWIEKDALVGVLESVCPAEDVPYFSCRGYTSQSEVWSAAQRLGQIIDAGKRAVVIHLGDHDPSGIDMTRDIGARLAMFIAQDVYGREPGDEVESYVEELDGVLTIDRIALNADQVAQYNPPPNPAKLTDSRAIGYISEHGDSSWELDALEPTVLARLIASTIDKYRDPDLWEEAVDRELDERKVLSAVSNRWGEVKDFLS